MNPDWIKDLPKTRETARFVYREDDRQLDRCDATVISRVYAGQTEYTARVFLIDMPRWTDDKLVVLQAIHAANWQARGMWSFDLAQYALIYDEHQLFLSLQTPGSPLKLSCARYLEAVLLCGSSHAAREFETAYPHWRNEEIAPELMDLCWRCYGSARSSQLYDEDVLKLGFDNRLGSIDPVTLESVLRPNSHISEDQIDDFLVNTLQAWLSVMYSYESFERGVKLALHYWTYAHRSLKLPLKLSEIDEDHPSLSRLLGYNPLPMLIQSRTPTARLQELVDQFYVDDRQKKIE